MTQQSRAHLRQEFQDGERPDGGDFTDLIDSSLNQLDDGVSIASTDSTLVLSRGLRLGNSADNQAGTLRFNGGVPEYHDGSTFVPIGGGGGDAFQVVGAGPDVAYTGGGTVGIGDFAITPSVYRFEVELGTNTGTSEQVRFGNAVMYRGTGAQAGSAYFAHVGFASNNNFAVRQRATGEVSFNAPVGSPIVFSHGGSAANTRMTIAGNGNVLVRTLLPLTNDPSVVFHVGGHAVKNSGGGLWLVSSDKRIKQNIKDYKMGLEQIMAIRPVEFRYNGKAGTNKGEKAVGVVAQEIEKILPDTVCKTTCILDKENGEVKDLRIFDGNALIYALINAVKELTTRVEALEGKRPGEGSK